MLSFPQLRTCLVRSLCFRASFSWTQSRRRRHFWRTSKASLWAAHLFLRLTTPFLLLPNCQKSFSWHVLSWFAAPACNRRFRPPTTASSPSWSGPVIFSNYKWVHARTRCQYTASSPAGLLRTLPSPYLLAAVVPSLRHRLPSLRRSLSPGKIRFCAVPATSRLPSLTLSRTGALHPLSTPPAAPPAPSGRLRVIAPSKYMCF